MLITSKKSSFPNTEYNSYWENLVLFWKDCNRFCKFWRVLLG